MTKPHKCRYCGCLPKLEYFPGVMGWRAQCPTVGCANHRRIFPMDSSDDGAIQAWNRYSTGRRAKRRTRTF